MSAETVQTVWIVTLAVYAVVLVVVAVLLTLIVRAARSVRDAVGDVWTVGQRIANNTIHIALLGRTNRLAGEILDASAAVVRATAAVQAHAERCPGCPACVLGPEWSR